LLIAAPTILHAADHATFFNEDAWHYFTATPDVKRGKGDEPVEVMRPEFTLTRKGLENYIDEIARGHVTHFLMNLNTQRANFPSKTFEPLWKSLDEPERDHLDYIRAMKALYETGVDPYEVWINRCRMKGMHPWISVRMNDLHRTDDPKSPNISTFWHEHPEFRLKPKGFDSGLNYMFEPVRKRMLDFVTEVLERYDPDGLELDLIRFPFYLPKGREKECAPVFTAYMREIREVVNAAAAKRGHAITFSVRLLPKPAESLNLGMEADVWAKEGIVDMIVPCNHWVTIDFDIPLAEWRSWTGDRVPIVPGADSGITEGGKRRLATFDEYRRWARNMHERGARGLYLFNLFMHPQDGPVWNGILSGGLDPIASASTGEPVATKNYVYKHSAGQPRDMEIYLPPGHDPATARVPGLVLFHGGGWTGGNLSQFRAACQYFASRGLVAATVNYRMLTKAEAAGLPAGETKKRVCISDAKSAIRWFKQNAGELGIDPARIVTGGGSAGGHISALATLNIGLDDPADPKDIDTTVVAYLWFNPAFETGDSKDPEVDVLRHLKKSVAPAIVFFGANDGWKNGWDAVHERLKDLGNNTVDLWLAEGQGHGFFNKEPWQTLTLIAADRFLAAQGLLQGVPTLKVPATGEKLVVSNAANQKEKSPR
jgi:acetyl esterase/lipase